MPEVPIRRTRRKKKVEVEVEVFTRSQAARILDTDRGTLRGAVLMAGIPNRSHPTRLGLFVYREDIELIARALRVVPRWELASITTV